MKLGNLVKSFTVVTTTLFVSLASAQDVELATNLSFEDPIGVEGDTASDQWNPFFAAGAAGAGTGITAPLDGVTHGEMRIAGDPDSFAGLQYQIDDITEGLEYTFSFNARSEGPTLGGVDGEFRFEFVNAAGEFVGGQFGNNEPIAANDTYASFSQTRVAPAGATSLRAVIAVQSFGAGLDGSNSDTGALFVDSASIQGPPIGTPPPGAPTPGPVMELVSNPSFEDAIGAPGDQIPSQWNPFDNGGNTVAGVDTTAPLTGSTHGFASISGDDASFSGLQQEIENIVPGEDYTFSFSARSAGVNLGGIDAEFRIEYLDANGNFVGDQFANNAPVVATDTYASFTQTNTAPTGAVNLRAVIAVQSFGAGLDASNTGTLFVDDASIIGSLVATGVLKGDVDLNGVVNFLDITPFIEVLSSNGSQAEADANCDGSVNFLDIQDFINILASQ